MIFLRTAYLCLTFLIMTSTWPQDYIYKHYGLQDGLANLTIHCIFQDKDGFLWIGTESGLCRYDGSQFKTFTVKEGLPGNDVFGIYQDSKERLWLKSFKKEIAYIYRGKIYTERNDRFLKKIRSASRLTGVTEDKHGNIGLCDAQGVYVLSPAGEVIHRIDNIDGKKVNGINMYTDRNGEMVLCTGNALYTVRNGKLYLLKQLVPHGEVAGENEILANNNYIIMGSGKRQFVYLNDTIIAVPTDSYLYKFSPVSDSMASVNTVNGAWLINTKNYSIQKILPGVRVTNVFVDREKNMWIGTISDGLYKISSQQIVNKKIGDKWNDIYYIAKEQHHLIVANTNTQLFEFSNDHFSPRFLLREGNPSRIFSYEKLPNGHYITSHGMGMESYYKGKEIARRIIPLLKNVSAFGKDHLLVSANGGAIVVRKKDLSIIDTIWKRKAYCSLQVKDSLYVGSLNGLFVLKKENDRYHIIDSMFHSSIINNIRQSADGLVWVSTFENGLYCLRNSKPVRHFSDSLELPVNNTRCLFIQHNTIWLGTDKGLVKIMPGPKDYSFRHYSTSNGLPSDIINSVYADSNMIYVGTPEGLCYFDETKIETSSICNLVLTDVRIDGKPADIPGRYSLGGQQRFSIEFSGISFRSEREMTYRYKINGIHNNWQTTRQNSLEFASFPYGDFELVIVAVNKFGKESQPLKLQLHIRRPFHKTTWFIVLMVLIPVSILLFLYNRRMNVRKQKQVHQLRQEIRILELEQMALRAQMNPHFIFNCLNTMQQLITEKDSENTELFIASFSELIRQTLDNAPELFIPLDSEIKFLTNYFELERIRLEDRFGYRIDIDSLQKIEEYFVPNMVIQPYVENAIKHGIRYKKGGKGFIEVKFVQQNGLLRCTVTDNGVGRKQAAEMQNIAGPHHISRAMGITSNRIRSLNAMTDGNISIAVEDLEDEHHTAAGTKVTIDFYKINHTNDKNSDH